MAKQLTTGEYADLYGCGPRNIQKMIKDKKKLPFVKKVKRMGKIYVLEVPQNLSKKSFTLLNTYQL